MTRFKIQKHRRVLITAGPVYGKLDDNKLVSNRSRGIWAHMLACDLADRGHIVTFLMPKVGMEVPTEFARVRNPDLIEVVRHDGFEEYQRLCIDIAPQVDVAVMAAAVVNWIPKTAFPGKMPTKDVGDELQITFKLAPRVLDRMKLENSKLTLIGCKLVVDGTQADLFKQAYNTLVSAKCTAVVANNLKDLKRKYIIYRDASTHEYMLGEDPQDAFTSDLISVIEDDYYTTHGAHFSSSSAYESSHHLDPDSWMDGAHTVADWRFADQAKLLFDAVANKYRACFSSRLDAPEKSFGSLAVRVGDTSVYLVSPREKLATFSSEDAVFVYKIDPDNLRVYTSRGLKASLNAPLLIRHLEKYREFKAVVHYHDIISNPGQSSRHYTRAEYAPPGSKRDNNRDSFEPVFNITEHGCIAALDDDLNFWSK